MRETVKPKSKIHQGAATRLGDKTTPPGGWLQKKWVYNPEACQQ